MINKKVSKIIGPVAGIMGFIIAIGTISMPVYAAENINSNYEISQNGVKFKVTDIVGTKHKVKVNAVIEREDGLTDLDYRNLQFNIYMDTNERSPKSAGWGTDGDSTIKIEVEDKSEEGFSETGNVRADVVLGEYDFNGSLIIPVDFTESFKQVMEKDLNIEVSDKLKILKFESDAIGTRIKLDDQSDEDTHRRTFYEDPMEYIFKVDEKIYLIDSIGYDYDENGYRIYETTNLTYNDIKDAEKISILPLKCNMIEDEIEEFYQNSVEDDKKNQTITDNVEYSSELLFNDGTKGEIKVERTGGKIKVYCNSDSDKKSMLMATRIYGAYMDEEEYYYDVEAPVIYKSTENVNQYIVEFNDTNKDKKFSIFLENIISNSDKFELGNEISVK